MKKLIYIYESSMEACLGLCKLTFGKFHYVAIIILHNGYGYCAAHFSITIEWEIILKKLWTTCDPKNS